MSFAGMGLRRRRYAAPAGLALLALLAPAGCSGVRRVARALGSHSTPVKVWEGDPVALATVKTVVVFPFVDNSPEPGFDALMFSTQLANQITAAGQLKVIYPRQALAVAASENRKVRRHNAELRQREMLGINPVEDRAAQTRRANTELRESVAGEEDVRKPVIDPVHNLKDAVKIGRQLKADAVLVGQVTDYDPYTRPRISVVMAVVATGTAESAAQTMAELTQWGVPRRAASAQGIIWSIQQNFDSSVGNIGFDVKTHAYVRHTEEHGYDTELYVRSPSKYCEFVGSLLARALLKAREEAVAEAGQRALVEAKRRRESQEAVRRKLRALVEPAPVLPDPDKMIATRLADRKDRSWRPDIYNHRHPRKAAQLYRKK